MPSPPSTPPEKVKPHVRRRNRRRREDGALDRRPGACEALRAFEVDLERQHLLAVDPAEAPVGQDDAEPVAGVAIDDGEDLAVLGAIELAIGEAGAGAHRRARHDDAQLRIALGRAPATVPRGATATTTSAITASRARRHDPPTTSRRARRRRRDRSRCRRADAACRAPTAPPAPPSESGLAQERFCCTARKLACHCARPGRHRRGRIGRRHRRDVLQAEEAVARRCVVAVALPAAVRARSTWATCR